MGLLIQMNWVAILINIQTSGERGEIHSVHISEVSLIANNCKNNTHLEHTKLFSNFLIVHKTNSSQCKEKDGTWLISYSIIKTACASITLISTCWDILPVT